MELRLTPELQAKVERAAAENNSDAEGYLQQLVEHYLDMTSGSGSRSRKVWTNSTGENT
jgi:hypothetical protein